MWNKWKKVIKTCSTVLRAASVCKIKKIKAKFEIPNGSKKKKVRKKKTEKENERQEKRQTKETKKEKRKKKQNRHRNRTVLPSILNFLPCWKKKRAVDGEVSVFAN